MQIGNNNYEFAWPGFFDATPAIVLFIILPAVLVFGIFKYTSISKLKKIACVPLCIVGPAIIFWLVPFLIAISGIYHISDGVHESSTLEIYYSLFTIFGIYSNYVWAIVPCFFVYFIYKNLKKQSKKVVIQYKGSTQTGANSGYDQIGLFARKKYIDREKFPVIIQKLAKSFEASREEYILGSLLQLKREGVDISNIQRKILPGSELEDALKGFQLTSMIGIAWNYIKSIEDQLAFDNDLSEYISAMKGTKAWHFRRKYADCKGNMDTLAKTLSIDVHKTLGSPSPEGEFQVQFQGGAYVLIGLCQADTHAAFGDTKMEQIVRAKIKTYLK